MAKDLYLQALRGFAIAGMVLLDRVGKVGVSEANRDGFEGKRPSP